MVSRRRLRRLRAALVLRARRVPAERVAWASIGAGLLLYGACSTVYNLELAAGSGAVFPSLADALWLSLLPLTLAGMVALVRARHLQVGASLWLDGLIGGSVVAAVAAVFLLHPIVELTVGEGWASAAHLAYPLGDLLLMGFAVVLWGAGGWRIDAWFGLAAGLALIAMSDGVYVAAQAGDGWTPGTTADLGYAAGSLLLALAAWRAPAAPGDGSPGARVALPIAFTVASFGLVLYEAFTDLDVLAVALIRLTLLAVVVRLGLTLWWLSRQRADLEALAASDPLTGLGNYRAFQAQLHGAVAAAAGPVSVIVLDLDHFKALNDTFGHAEGDRVLPATATTLSRTVGEAGFVARVGGEEFAIALPDAGEAAAVALAERCRAALASLPATGTPLACSAGVASYPAHAEGVAKLLHAADGALYWAKRSGRDRVRCFDPEHVVALLLHEQRHEVEALLATAGSVAPVFQPVMEVATGRVAGFEALARFAPPYARPPQLWFAQAHRCGLGPALEARAIAAALAVPDRPAGTFLSLNVSPAALLSPEVKAALPFDLEGIAIELTEHEAFGEDVTLEFALATLARARGADRARRRRRGLRRPAAADPPAPRHRQGRPFAGGRHPRRPVQARAARGARALRRHHRRRGLRRGRRGGGRAARACGARHHLRTGLRARAAGAGVGGDSGGGGRRGGGRRRPRHARGRQHRGRLAGRGHRGARAGAHARGAQARARRRHPPARRRGGRDLTARPRRRLPDHGQRPRVVGGGRALAARGLPDDCARGRRTGHRAGDRATRPAIPPSSRCSRPPACAPSC